MSLSTSHSTVSLKSLFPKCQIVGTSDIECSSCSSSPENLDRQGVLVIGINESSDEARQVIEGVQKGATAILTERFLPSPIPQCIVPDVHEAFSLLSHAIRNHPSRKLLTIGVIGTHGKTTATLLTAAMIKHVGGRVGYFSTLGASDGAKAGLRADPQANAEDIAEFMQTASQNGAPGVVIELTDDMLCSHAASGIEFDVILVTSLRQSQRIDRLRSRGVENAMLRLLNQVKKHGVVVYNADDARLNRWIERHQPYAIGYGIDAACDVMGKRLKCNSEEQSMVIQVGRCIAPLTTKLIGDHSVRHILGAVAIGYAFGLEIDEIVSGIERLQRIPGRLQRVPCERRRVYVDLADQADRLAVSLHALQKLNGSPIICVAEVPEAASPEQLHAYGRVLERAASKVILTQSRSTTASGQKAIWQVLDGCNYPAGIQIIPNRETAIELALRSCQSHEQVLLAGWGTARWMNNQSKVSNSDLEVASECLKDEGSDSKLSMEAMQAEKPVLRIFGAA